MVATADAAAMHFDSLRRELEEIGLQVGLEIIAPGATDRDFIGTLTKLTNLVSEGERVVLDVTLGLRHLPFLHAAALAYLTAFKGIKLAGVYYAAVEQSFTRPDGSKAAPIFDLTTTFDLVEWYHAVRSASQSGDLRPLQAALADVVREEKAASHARHPLEGVKNALDTLAPNLAAGLPLETGLAARRVLDALRHAELEPGPPHLARISLQPFEARLAEWAVPEGVKDRAAIVLDEDELRRQMRLIRWYAERGNVQEALLLLREWLLSRVLIETGDRSHWLGYDNRKNSEAVLNSAAHRGRLKLGNGQSVGGLWSKITDRRNLLAHADTDEKLKLPSKDELTGWIKECEALLDRPFDLEPPGGDRVLLTPLGLTPGVVYTAASLIQPDQVIVITSREAQASAAIALEMAGLAHVPCLIRSLSDPFAGIEEARALKTGLDAQLLQARELVVNLTGGTTMMQFAVEEIAQSAARLGVPVRRVLLIDRRPVEEQRRDPYQLGEVIHLSKVEADGPGADPRGGKAAETSMRG